MNWKLIGLAGLATVAGAMGAVACGGDDEGDGLTDVTLMLDWTPNTNHAGIYIAKANGWYEEQGINLKIVEPAQGGVEQIVAADRAEFGISIQEAVIPARAADIPIVSVGAIIQHNLSGLMSLESEGIVRPRDLEGKTYGGFGGALETALIKQLVQCDGGDADRVRFVEVGNIDYLVGMEQGQFDFVWIFEGWDGVRAREVEKKSISTLQFKDYLNCIPDWYTPVIITSEKVIKEKPDVVRKFMAATAKGYEVANTDAAASAKALLEAAPELDEALLNAAAAFHVGQYVDSGRKWGTQDEPIWTAFAAFLKSAGLIEKDIDVKAAYTNEFLP
ncbi:MAG: ABC transporter substrate-binding protein [Dehalococcoidia bacterium]